MKVKSRHLIGGIAFLLLAVVGNLNAQLNYSSTNNSAIAFPGDTTFSFSPGVDNFRITTGTASGLLGEMTGIFNIGTITTIGNVTAALVTGSGTFIVHDGAFNLSATLTWVNIAQFGSGDSLNLQGVVNLTGITYAGSNPDLDALAAAGSAINVLSFQFVPPVSLAELRDGPGPHTTSFSGSVAVPEPGTTALIVLGFAALSSAMRRRTKKSTH